MSEPTKPVVDGTSPNVNPAWSPMDSIMALMGGDTPVPAEPVAPAVPAAEPAKPAVPAPAAEPAKPAVPAPEPVKPAKPAVPAPEPVKPVVPAPAPDDVPADVLGQPEPEPVKPVEPEGEVPPEVGTNPKAKNAWTAVKSENKALKEEIAKLKAEKAERPPEAAAVEIERLRQENLAYEERVGKMDVTQSKKFRMTYDLPLDHMFAKGTGILQRMGRTAEESQQIMMKLVDPKLGREGLEAVLGDLPGPAQGAMLTVATEFGQVLSARQQAIDKWRDTMAANKEADAAEQAGLIGQNIEADTKKAVEAAVAEGNWFFKASEKDGDWNSKVEERKRAVMGILRNGTPTDLVKWVVEGITARPLRALYSKERERATKLQGEIRRLMRATPGVSGDEGPDATPALPSKSKPVSPDSFIGSLFADQPRQFGPSMQSF